MRDPWLPVATILAVLLAVWLGIFGPMPTGFTEWLRGWQTLVAATVALFAAGIAFHNTTRSLDHAQRLENKRRIRKHAAVRAVLPLALAQVAHYAQQSAWSLNDLIRDCADDELLPKNVVPAELRKPLPAETLKTLAEFIEYADTLDVSIIESVVAWIQIHDSRMQSLIEKNHDPNTTHIIVRTNIEGYIVDAARIYAGAVAVFDYARGRSERLPATISWNDVRHALTIIGFRDDVHKRLYDSVQRSEQSSNDRFAELRSPSPSRWSRR